MRLINVVLQLRRATIAPGLPYIPLKKAVETIQELAEVMRQIYKQIGKHNIHKEATGHKLAQHIKPDSTSAMLMPMHMDNWRTMLEI